MESSSFGSCVMAIWGHHLEDSEIFLEETDRYVVFDTGEHVPKPVCKVPYVCERPEEAVPVLASALRVFMVRRGDLLKAFRTLEDLDERATSLCSAAESAPETRLKEELITQLLIKADAVSTENNQLIRGRRRELIKRLHSLSPSS
ncbi:hypothetical protein NDN08_004459 [Rhodosorus marinus]|uniref:BAG domain-containing protein n=1 Tax=Rhodosorus marinus TaxID=101924 RepID=A0AAV8ULF1_9RHOD|nr:hypothetical protein NDN08_004459 [Rhodosorus marinus]